MSKYYHSRIRRPVQRQEEEKQQPKGNAYRVNEGAMSLEQLFPKNKADFQSKEIKFQKKVSQTKKRRSTPLQHTRQQQTTSFIIQKKDLEQGKLNVAGENHSISGKKRNEEKDFINTKGIAKDNYWLEDELKETIPADPQKQQIKKIIEGDPLPLRIGHNIGFMVAKVKWINDNIGDMYDKNKKMDTKGIKVTLNSMKKHYAQFIIELDQYESNPADWSHLSTTKKDSLIKTANETKEDLKDFESTRIKLINAINLYDAPSLTSKPKRDTIIDPLLEIKNMIEETKSKYYKIITTKESKTNRHDINYLDEEITYQRSKGMHKMAQNTSLHGVWKVGNYHIKQIKKEGKKEQQINYNILTQKDFDSQVDKYLTEKEEKEEKERKERHANIYSKRNKVNTHTFLFGGKGRSTTKPTTKGRTATFRGKGHSTTKPTTKGRTATFRGKGRPTTKPTTKRMKASEISYFKK